MSASILRSPQTVRVLIIAFGLAVFAQLASTDVWDAWRWAPWIVSLVVGAPIALTFVAPELRTRGNFDELGESQRTWWRIVPLLFVPWILATCLQIPWQVADLSPQSRETLESIDSLCRAAYNLGLLATTFAVIYVWHRSRVFARNGVLTVISLAIFSLTSVGSWFVVILGWVGGPTST